MRAFGWTKHKELQEPVFDKNEQVLYKGELATFMNYNRQETVEEALRPCQISN